MAQLLGGNDAEQRQGWHSVNTKHTVSRGESLSSISEKHYGKAGFWDVIFMENLDKVDNTNPNNLKVGVRLVIP